MSREGKAPRGLIHLLPVGAAAGLYLILARPVLQVLALDLESLMYNLAEDHAARVNIQALTLDTARIHWALAPLFLLVATRAAYALLARWRATPSPLWSGPIWVRALLALVAAAGVLLFAEPGARALSVRYMAEGFWWVQWSGNVQPAMEWIRAQTPTLVYPALAISACFILWISLRPPPARRSRRLRWLRRATLGGTGLLLVLFWSAAGGGQATAAALSGGQGLFLERCGACHSRSRPLFRVKSPAEWRRTVTRMRELEGARLTPDEAEKVNSYLTATRAFSDAWTFRSRCQRCHGIKTLTWANRPPEDWARIAERLARWSPYYYRLPIREQIVSHLSRASASDGPPLDLEESRYSAYKELDRRCGVCHSLGWNADRYRNMDEQGVAAMVRRMLKKNNARLTPAEAASLTRDYQAAIKDQGLFNRLFPHDLPMRTERLKW